MRRKKTEKKSNLLVEIELRAFFAVNFAVFWFKNFRNLKARRKLSTSKSIFELKVNEQEETRYCWLNNAVWHGKNLVTQTIESQN